MPFTENALALANMCLVIHVMGKFFNILKELLYENIFLEIYFCKEFTHNINKVTRLYFIQNKISSYKITFLYLMLCIFTPKKVAKLVRVLAMWLRVKCAIAMFTEFYEEYWLDIVVNTFLFTISIFTY